MASLGELLCTHSVLLTQRWYDRWRKEGPLRPDMSEAALKDHLQVQLEAIGRALQEEKGKSESPRELWQQEGRLDPEQRVRDDVPIEEVVREYGFVTEEVRAWLDEQGATVSVADYSYFSVALFELAAESARRYACFEAERVRTDRAHYVAGIAHQLRTPVSTIKLHIQRAERGQGTDLRSLSRASRSLRRLERLVDGVLRLERFKATELPVHPEEVSPAKLLDELIEDYEHDAFRKGLRLDVTGNRSLRMEADPDLLVDALGNLVQNAIKYTARGFVRLGIEEESGCVVFQVEDSGPGISPERRQELFRPTAPGQPGGVGLGLTIAMRAAVAQGGTIDVKSEEGKGSCFILRIPRRVRSRSAPSAATE